MEKEPFSRELWHLNWECKDEGVWLVREEGEQRCRRSTASGISRLAWVKQKVTLIAEIGKTFLVTTVDLASCSYQSLHLNLIVVCMSSLGMFGMFSKYLPKE